MLFKQRGTALLVTLFIVSLAATIATYLMLQFTTINQRTYLLLTSRQAKLYAEGATLWATTILSTSDSRTFNSWHFPIKIPTEKIAGYTIETTIDDMQGRFNINNLTDNNYFYIFQRLLQLVDPALTPEASLQIVEATKDWVSPTAILDLDTTYYPTLNPPYQASHQLMANISELRLIKGVTAELFHKLTPYLTALPAITPINLNSASLPIIMSLSPKVTYQSAYLLTQLRERSPFSSNDQLVKQEVFKNSEIAIETVTLKSCYFLITSRVTVGIQQVTLYTLVERLTDIKPPRITKLWQSLNTL